MLTQAWPLLQSPLPQQSPCTQLAPHGRSPLGQLPLQDWVRGMHTSPQGWVLLLQLKPQLLPLQLAEALAGAGQRSQRSPQESTLRLSRHWSPQRWKPLRQSNTQLFHVGKEPRRPVTHDARGPRDGRLPVLWRGYGCGQPLRGDEAFRRWTVYGGGKLSTCW